MRVSRAIAHVGLLVLAYTVPRAQIQQMNGPACSPIADDDLSHLIAGDFSGDGLVDAVVIANGKPVLRESVEAERTYIGANRIVAAIATVPGGGAGGRDRFVGVGPDGLSLFELIDPLDPEPWSVTTLRAAGYWATAVDVEFEQIDGLHGKDIVAVTPTRVVIACSDGTGGWLSDVTFLAGTGIDGVELVDWDGAAGGVLEIAVLMVAGSGQPARIRIMRATGTALGTLYSSSDRIVAAPLAATGLGKRYLAAVGTNNTTGAQELMLLSTISVVGPLSLGAAGVYDIAAGDWTGDGIDDFVLGTNASQSAQLYVVEESASQLTLAPVPQSLPVGHPARDTEVQDGGMALADVDRDSDLDLITAVQGDYDGLECTYFDSDFSGVECTRNDLLNELDRVPWIGPGAELLEGTLHVSLVTPEEVILGAHYEYSFWHAASIIACLDASPVVPTSTAEIGPEFTTLTLGPLDHEESPFPDLYTLIVRQVQSGLNGEQSPALVVMFYSSLNADVFESGWPVLTTGLLAMDDPGDSGGHASGAPPPPQGPNPPEP